MIGFKYISKGMMAGILLSVIIAFMLSLIPNMEIFNLNDDQAVFKHQNNSFINSKNIVNFVESFPIEMSIKKVSWKQNTLAIDFIVERNKKLDTNEIYKDLYTVIRSSLVESANVKEILIRVFLDDMNKLFVAVSAKKTDIEMNQKMNVNSPFNYKEFLDQNFGLNYGNVIKQD